MLIQALDTPRRAPSEVDYALLWSTLLLLFFGMVMVYSASIAIAEAGKFTGHQPAYYLVRHSIFLCIGIIAAAVAFQVPLAAWQQMAPWLFVTGVVLLIVVLIPGVGRDVNGARRWLPLGIANLQPSELMKLFVVLYAADYTVRKMAVMHNLKKAFAPMAGAMILVTVLLLKEPDFGAFVVIISIAIGILFLGGLRARYFAVLIVLLLAAFAVLIVVSPYRRDRIFGFMDPWADAFGRGYQLSHALIAFGRGELFGVGLGASVEKLFYLPEAHTDFLLAVIAEELGLVGVLIVVALFALIIQRAFVIGRQAVALERLYPALVAMGIGIWIGVQGFINMGVNMGLLPTKGLTLPLMSFGGSGILANCVALAILLRVDWENRQLMRGAKL
ncbi:MAG: putative lipid II flippase FtsW [Betaproteobacteria bacterium]|uniref:Probable peptidoglycan glycosyltransferase FtsW n=1 Tax=Candidatus Proximibacter danicus TaxID=2954365 RepID=A0A9D7K1G5_9PROT|nr:putative lipid II flippase FtsW [Candidatus Proximibacter danicus]